MSKFKYFLSVCKDIVLDWICLTLLLIPGFADWIERCDKNPKP
jgi:hypothetical protein